jgi:two-component system, cell cycle response regulator
LRVGDVLCRLGGDEFVVLCPATRMDGALALAERLRARVAQTAARVVPEMDVTASLGVATAPDGAAGPDDLMRAADDALYAAKSGGRNRVAAFVPDRMAI